MNKNITLENARTSIYNDNIAFFEEEFEFLTEPDEEGMSIFGEAIAFGSFPLIREIIEKNAEQLKKPYLETDGFHPIYYLIGRRMPLFEKQQILLLIKEKVGSSFFSFNETIKSFDELCYAHSEHDLYMFVKEHILTSI